MNKKPLQALIFFLIFGFILTLISLFFPQQIGLYKQVSGWPLAVYEISYKKVVTIDKDILVDKIIESGSSIKWEIMALDILLWAFLLELAWVFYHKLPKRRIPKASPPSLDKRPA